MGPYDPEAYWYEFTGVMTNATPTDAYRGAGRPEATYVIERLVDAFARRIGKDPAEVRRMNFHAAVRRRRSTSIMGLSIDSGNYEPTFDRALELADYEQLRKEQQARRDAGDTKQLGIGLSSYIEMCGLAPSEILGALRYVAGGWDAAEIECRPTGKVVVRTGHIAARPGPRDLVVADRRRRPRCPARRRRGPARRHGGHRASAWTRTARGRRASAVRRVAPRDGEGAATKARTIAAHELEVAEDDLEWTTGAFRVKGAPDKAQDDPGARRLGVARARAAGGHRADARRHGRLRPAELHVAGGHPRLRGRGRHRDRARPTSCGTSPSTTAAT